MELRIVLSGTLTHRFELPSGMCPWATKRDLQSTEERIMAKIDDAVAALAQSVDAAITRGTTEITDLQTQISQLQATVDSGGASQATIDALAAAQAKLDGFAQVAQQALTKARGQVAHKKP